MKIHWNGTQNGQSFNLTSEYKVVASTASTFKVNISESNGGQTAEYTAYAWRNGTVAAIYFASQNTTGSSVSLYYFLAMAGFSVEQTFAEPATLDTFTNSNLVQVTGTSQIHITGVLVSVTNYAAGSLPLTLQSCGESSYLTRFSLQTGTVSGVPFTLLTAFALTGQVTTSSGTQNVDFSLQVTSLTRA
jgi:hypothetical protein